MKTALKTVVGVLIIFAGVKVGRDAARTFAVK